MNCSSGLTKTQRGNLRRYARTRILKATGNRLWTTCWWCNEVIVWFQKLPVEWVLNKGNPADDDFKLKLNLGGEIHEFEMATVDHLKEIKQGGGSELANLVPSCIECNRKRSN